MEFVPRLVSCLQRPEQSCWGTRQAAESSLQEIINHPPSAQILHRRRRRRRRAALPSDVSSPSTNCLRASIQPWSCGHQFHPRLWDLWLQHSLWGRHHHHHHHLLHHLHHQHGFFLTLFFLTSFVTNHTLHKPERKVAVIVSGKEKNTQQVDKLNAQKNEIAERPAAWFHSAQVENNTNGRTAAGRKQNQMNNKKKDRRQDLILFFSAEKNKIKERQTERERQLDLRTF